jgi:hypothetical protein
VKGYIQKENLIPSPLTMATMFKISIRSSGKGNPEG